MCVHTQTDVYAWQGYVILIKECGINWTNGEEQSGAERMRRHRHIFNHEFSGHIAIKMP